MSPRNIVDSQTGVSYEVIKRLGKGSFATCYLVSARFEDVPGVQCYALKKFAKNGHERQDEVRFSKIWNEIVIHCRISNVQRHPNLVTMLSSFTSEEGESCMLLEYCAGGNLADFVEQQPKYSLSEPEAARFLRQLLSGIDYMHGVHDVLHRDIKPGNVLLTQNGRTVKLADFGLACKAEDARRKASVCGTPNYVAPETILYQGQCYASDYWCLACTYYFMLCGSTPFQTSTIKGTYSKICRADYGYPRNFAGTKRSRDFIDRVLIVNPSYRLTMQEMLDHPLFQLTRRNSMANLHHIDGYETLSSHSSHSENSPPITPKPRTINRCHSMRDVNNNNGGLMQFREPVWKSLKETQLATLAWFCRSLHDLVNYDNVITTACTDQYLPDNYIAKWVDYTNKFGFGVMLRNGVRSVVYNDDSILSTVDGETFVFHPLKSNMCGEVVAETSANDVVREKIRSLTFVRKYMDQELNSSVPLVQYEHSDAGVGLCMRNYVTDVSKCDDAVVFTLSNESVQVNFTQRRLKVFLQRDADAVHVFSVTPVSVTCQTIVDRTEYNDNFVSHDHPDWLASTADVLQVMMERVSLQRHATRC